METAATQQIIADFPGGRTLRLTVGVMVMWDQVRYNVLRREGWTWLAAQGYTPFPKNPKEGEEAEPPEAEEVRRLCVARAQMLAALQGVEERQGEAGEWQPCALPAEWEGVEGFVRRVPVGFANIWHRWVLVLNPTAFLQTMGEPEKNGGAVIAF